MQAHVTRREYHRKAGEREGGNHERQERKAANDSSALKVCSHTQSAIQFLAGEVQNH